MDMISRFWWLAFVLLRPSLLFLVIGFVAGGVATVESEYVNDKMKDAGKIYQRVILPSAKRIVGDISEEVKKVDAND